MSCSRGNTNRTRPQKHQNKTVFKNNLHDTSKKTKLINSLSVTGVCERCKEIIDWKIKYKKYKPLTAPKKCVGCDQKNIKHAYHVLCSQCASKRNVCTKCCKPAEVVIDKNEEPNENNYENKINSILKTLPERKRRTIIRHIKKQENEGHIITDTNIEDMISEMGIVDLDDIEDSSEDISLLVSE